MTPAINLVRKAKVEHRIHEYQHDAAAESYGLEAVEKLGLAAEQVFKTLVVSLDGKTLAIGVVPVAGKLNLKQIAKAAGAKKASMADPAEVERTTGYVLGGVSPLGQKKRLATFIDASAEQFDTLHVSAGRRGLEIELAPADLARLTGGRFAAIAG
ncbi:Cys-tRNA(Pro) deacylase [Marinobacterium weihaiense]|uniref:Cys-tRNA(Pro)/Cys-tRNA(Cys) deacylase n=1 Tax=Marinobacterium weihaiense TaxID=2851016 RepID=A0ABS6M8X8_9GAMM|nr:Cys-tRNA(Pro) deacylase [Marinobacterium weihaiense]MBV0932640.1 Cys-tRNA(Pro) deacylase [Marinobacterium weihaiense]